MYLTRRDLYYPLLSLLITNTISVTLRWNTRRDLSRLEMASRSQIRSSPSPSSNVAFEFSPAQYDRPKYNIGGGKRALVFQLM